MELDKKVLGQVFTPRVLANFMASWLIEKNPQTLLDPAAGDGALIRPFRKVNQTINVTAIEIDKDMSAVCQKKLRQFKHKDVITGDFFDFVAQNNGQKKFDAITVNPPYVKGQFIPNKVNFFFDFQQRFDIKIKQTSNLYAYFIIAITSLLKPGGRASVLVPIELFNSNFGDDIKTYLIKNNFLRKVIFIDNKCNVFESAITTSAVLFLEAPKEGSSAYEIEFHNVKTLRNLRNLKNVKSASIKAEDLLSIKKWSSLKDSTSVKSVSEKDSVQLGHYITTKRGIATGANEFFHVSEQFAKENLISPKNLKPCVANINALKELDLSDDVFKDLVSSGAKCYLVDIHAPNSDEQIYLDKGMAEGLLQRYILANKKVWYQQEKREPAHILFNVFSRGKFNFILNSANVLNLTNNHCIYVSKGGKEFINQLWDLLNSKDIEPLIKSHLREYGNGLYKMEPRDLLDLKIPKKLWNKYITNDPITNVSSVTD